MQGRGPVPRQRSGSPFTRFLVIALSFLVFRSLPLGLLKVPQRGLRCGPELDKTPVIPAELLKLSLARTQPSIPQGLPFRLWSSTCGFLSQSLGLEWLVLRFNFGLSGVGLP